MPRGNYTHYIGHRLCFSNCRLLSLPLNFEVLETDPILSEDHNVLRRPCWVHGLVKLDRFSYVTHYNRTKCREDRANIFVNYITHELRNSILEQLYTSHIVTETIDRIPNQIEKIFCITNFLSSE